MEDAALYQALHRLEAKDWIESEWGLSENNRRAKYYSLTADGKTQLRNEVTVWRRYAEAVFKVIESRREVSDAASWRETPLRLRSVRSRRDVRDDVRRSLRFISTYVPTNSSPSGSRRPMRECKPSASSVTTPPAPAACAQQAIVSSGVAACRASSTNCARTALAVRLLLRAARGSRRRDADAGARHRRQRRHLQRAGCGHVAAAASPEPDRLVQVSETLPDGNPNSVSGGAFLDWRSTRRSSTRSSCQSRHLQPARTGRARAAERPRGVARSPAGPRRLPAARPRLHADDDRPGGDNDVVLLTEELWRTRFAGDASSSGDIVLDEVPRTVIGVLPRGAWLFREDTFFVPAVLRPGSPRAARAPHWAVVFGRLKPTIRR